MSVTFYGYRENADAPREGLGEIVDAVGEMNVSNVNAGQILRTLGYGFDYSGCVDPEELASRIKTALGDLGEYHPSAEYLGSRLADLQDIAEACIAHRCRVTWA